MRSTTIKATMLTAFTMVLFSVESVAQTRDRDYRDNDKQVKVVRKASNKRVISPSRVVYHRPSPVVRAVRTLPHSAITIRKNGVTLYFHAGRYYRPEPGRYVTVSAPVGFRIKTLPIGYKVVRTAGRSYYYYAGTYYIKRDNRYQVVEPPQDIVVYTLPREAELVMIDSKDFYLYNGVIYDIVMTPQGRAFKAVGQMDY